MKLHLVSGRELSPDDVALWSRLQRADPELDSPYFRPEFVQLVAAIRDDVEVAVIEEEGEVSGFFPFQRGAWQAARPVAAALSDFHGLIGRPRGDWTADELLRGCGLASWSYHHLPASQKPFRPYHCRETPSCFVDLSQGFEAFCSSRRRNGSRIVPDTLRKMDRAAKEVGPPRLEAHVGDDRVFRALLGWKAAQYVRTGNTNLFAAPWVVELLDRLRRQQTEGLAGMLSALYLGDRLAAVHLGMRAGGVLHHWFPAYDVELRQYSPGLIWFLETARTAAFHGIRRIDLGKPSETYKVRLMSGVTTVAEGTVDLRPAVRALRRGWWRARDCVRQTPLWRGAAAPVRWLRRLKNRLAAC
ncbi:MAG: GNAT family N-acetyltransferase [Thermoguttaceae bacterium]|jgi:CelD/BcsL family acetyltransferase involved in cellulose biosynthesis